MTVSTVKKSQASRLAACPPARVLAREPQHQFAQRAACRRTAGLALRVGPPPAHQLPMPAQQRRRCHHEPVPTPVREQSSKRSDERAIGGPKPRTLMLASQNRELVPQQHQFHVLGELGLSTPNEQPQNSGEGKVREGEEHRFDPPRPSKRPQAVLAPFSGFWCPRARVKQTLGRSQNS